MDVTKVVENVAEAVTEEVSNEAKSIFKKVKRWLIIALIAYSIFCTIAFWNAFRNNTSLEEGLAEAQRITSELREENGLIKIASGELEKQLLGAIADAEQLRTEINKLGGTSQGVGDSADDFGSLNEQFNEILSRYSTGSTEDRETKQDTEN